MAFIRVNKSQSSNHLLDVGEKENFKLFWKLMDIYLNQKGYNEEFSHLICENVNNSINASCVSKSIILYGEVQSGKTNNIIFLIGALFDLNYDIIIFIGGTNKLLLSQNKGRMDEFKTTFRIEKNIEIFNFVIEKSKSLISRIDEIIKYKGKIIINLLKEDKNLREFFDVLITTGVNGETFFHKKVAIIDDECDNASSPNRKIVPAIYEKINKILSSAPFAKYFGVSATPYSNIVTKNNDEIYPEKIIVLKSSSQYCGLKFFHSTEFNAIIKEQNETKSTFIEENNLDNVIYYIVNFLYLLMFKNQKELKPSGEMIFNIAQETSIHHNVSDKIKECIRHLSGFFPSKFYLVIDEFLGENAKLLNKSQKYSMYRYLKIIAKNNAVIELNSKESNFYESKGINILVGGVLLGRGFTFNNLLLMVILNVPNQIKVISGDVMLQRARWFGYRRPVSQYINIYMNKSTAEFYWKMKIVDELIRKYYIDRNFKNDKEAVEYVRSVFFQSGLKIPEK